MPLDVRGRTRATLKESTCVCPRLKGQGNPLNLLRDRDWGLKFLPTNEEFPVSASHKLALITSLPFVHTARRYYRFSEVFGLGPGETPSWCRAGRLGKMTELDHLEEVKVVTRFP